MPDIAAPSTNLNDAMNHGAFSWQEWNEITTVNHFLRMSNKELESIRAEAKGTSHSMEPPPTSGPESLLNSEMHLCHAVSRSSLEIPMVVSGPSLFNRSFISPIHSSRTRPS